MSGVNQGDHLSSRPTLTSATAMRLLYLTFFIFNVALAVVVPRKATYDGYKVVRLEVGEQLPKVEGLIEKLSLLTWNGGPKEKSEVDIVVPADKVAEFEASTADLDSKVMHENLGASIANEADYPVYAIGSANSTWFSSYHPYADHIQFLNDLRASYPSNSEIITIGNSLQGRPITGIHFYGTGQKGIKPAVIFHGTVHAREWITTMVTEYFAYSFLSSYASNSEVRTLLNKYDFYIFPVVNPDGRAPSDAPENVVLANFVNKIAASPQKLKLYIDYHSYSQLFMTLVTSNNAEYQSLAQGVVAAIKSVYGTVFKAGPICPTIYQVSGSSVDYVTDVTKAQYSFTSELRDTGNYGFVLPANQILPSGVEAFAGLRYLLGNLK
ncbi:MAG: hypothetical protein Q9167_007444 [Letrouitia subvulpina]